jgi:hypothetical protein
MMPSIPDPRGFAGPHRSLVPRRAGSLQLTTVKEGLPSGECWVGLVALGGLVSLLTGLALAQAKKPDATLSLTEGTVGVGIGYSWGKGALSYKGKTSGTVYDPKKIEDFDGNYTAAGAGATIGGGAGVTA